MSQSKEAGQLLDTPHQPALYPTSISLLPTLCPLNLSPLILPEGFSNPTLGHLFKCTALVHFDPTPRLSGKCLESTLALQDYFTACESPSFGLFWMQMALVFLQLDIWTPPAGLS